MLFRQFFDKVSSTYTYVLASGPGREALIIDPVLGHVESYLALFERLDLRLVKAIDTHLHADHITGLGALRDRTKCITVMGEQTSAEVVSMRVREGESIDIDGISLGVIYTPGHTDDSYSFRLSDRVFTGDTLLIRGTGRTDFQAGDPAASYDSIFNKLLRLPDDTLVYPAHDYKGETVSTIGEEKRFNPRLQVASAAEYADIMNNLGLSDPRMMDVAVPANRIIGQSEATSLTSAQVMAASDAVGLIDNGNWVFVDLREHGERRRDGYIPSSVHVPYTTWQEQLEPGSLFSDDFLGRGRNILLYCAFGERSALALKTAEERGCQAMKHLAGGYSAWLKADGPTRF
jgi:glyoxylase-like metal-dependent hydrolase (beta-lactamase superfamily II)/rhodanese-related sulfurtransferase